jgi:hypothetical protein
MKPLNTLIYKASQKIGGGIWRKEDGAGLRYCPLERLPEGGLRWHNISDRGGVG